MSIKKSYLESKFSYRISKVFFRILPFLVGAYFIFKKDLNIIDTIQENNFIIVLIIGGLFVYYIVLNIIWRSFLYLAFGGLEDDITKKVNVTVVPAAPVDQLAQKQNQAGSIIGFIFLMILIFIIANYSSDNSLSGISTKHTYGTPCTDSSTGKKGLYGTNGNCLTCSSGSVAVTNPVNNCSNGIAGVYCCSTTSGSNTGTSKSGSTCVPTGCGTQWHCSGDYYPASGTRTHISGCFPTSQSYLPSWSGVCRQCP